MSCTHCALSTALNPYQVSIWFPAQGLLEGHSFPSCVLGETAQHHIPLPASLFLMYPPREEKLLNQWDKVEKEHVRLRPFLYLSLGPTHLHRVPLQLCPSGP